VRQYLSMTLPKGTSERELVQKVSSLLPAFKDVFDEETFYICVACIVIFSIVGAIVAARYVTIKDAGHKD